MVPERLDGRTGRNRGVGRMQIAAEDDRSALLAWLARYADSPATLSSYRKESERLLLWCVLQHQVALANGYALADHRLSLYGFCSRCQAP